MTLPAGTRIGPYDVLERLGAGGQGEVYKARDSRLNRFVAIKVLPETLSRDPEWRARFEREARTLASLSHPHICPVFDVGRHGDIDYLVMECLEGETLADRLARSTKIPLDEALRLATGMADALDTAHRQGIAHRDVKPSNIMLTANGAKLVDFGLAKARVMSRGSSSVSQLPTNVAVTGQGTILGTLQYMSPEQLEGREADARSDIFSFGATLYEMVTGVRAFDGKSQVSLMAAILEHEPRPVSSLLPMSPPLLERVLRKCLAKDPNKRWQSAADVIEALDWIRGGVRDVEPATPRAPAPRRRGSRVLAAATIASAIVALILAAMLVFGRTNDTALWVSVIPPESNFSALMATAVSPDGKQVVFSAPNAAGVNVLWLRSIDAPDARELQGTASGVLPFWSPDGKSIAFFAFSSGKLARIDLAGGTPQILADAANPRGGTWGPDGTIVFVPAPSSDIMKVPASGGTATTWQASDAAVSAFGAPHFLPGGKHVLYFRNDTDPRRQGLYSAAVEGGAATLVANIESKGEYAGGYLFYCKGADLFAQPFDASTLELRGDARRVASNIGFDYGETAIRAFSIGAGGTLAYYNSRGTLATTQLTWVDRSGKPLDRVGDPGYYYGFAASPDRRKAVLEGFGPSGKPEVWLIEFANGIASKLTEGNTPVWDARSERVLYIDLQSKLEAIEISSGKKEPVLPTAVETLGGFLQGVSPDGRYLAWTTSTGGQSDPFVAALDGSEKPRRYLQTPSNEFRTQVSPDGKWIAYVSNESGSDQVMVDSFPQAGQRRRISPEGGAFPEWRPDGRELYYLAPAAGARRKLMVVRVESGTTFTASRPEFVFETPELGTNPRRGQFAVFGNGEKFLMNVAVPETKPRAITLVVNWPALLK